jgi:hypothetical protein
LEFKDIEVEGELAVRSLLNYSRLEGKWYRPDEVFSADQHGWPGDWEGRLILALTMLGQATHREPAYLRGILNGIPAHLNKSGYFGPVLPPGVNDEQQMAGHSWLLRGLVEYLQWKQDDSVLPLIENVVQNLLIPSLGNYARYPLAAATRNASTHWRLSRLHSITENYAENSDAGCAFIMLDGATHVYELLRKPELKELIEEMIARYRDVSLDGLHIQTHATLSGLRGILRMYELTGESSYLDMAIRTFNFYKQEAWTEAYGNYNWFGLPRWTEPCGIVDSFMVAFSLFRHTLDPRWLADAQLIYYNAFCYAQRANGSFGTDRCVGAKLAEHPQFLTAINYETYWCCTMRAGEGFARAIQYNYLTDGERVLLTFFNNSVATIRLQRGAVTLRQTTSFPYAGVTSLEVLAAPDEPAELAIFIPPGVISTRVFCNGKLLTTTSDEGILTLPAALSAGRNFQINFEMPPQVVRITARNNLQGYYSIQRGPAVLGARREALSKTIERDAYSGEQFLKYVPPEPLPLSPEVKLNPVGNGEFEVVGNGLVLSPLCDVRQLTLPDTIRQIVFKEQ